MGFIGTLVIYAMLTKLFGVLCCLWAILAAIGLISSPRGIMGKSKFLFVGCCLCYCCMQTPIVKLPVALMVSKLTGGKKDKKDEKDEKDEKDNK